MVKQIAKSVGFAFGACLKFYLFFGIPTVWAWMPFIALEKMYNIAIK